MINREIYSINIKKLVSQILHPEFRLPKVIAYINSLIVPVIFTYNSFFEFVNDIIYKTQHNGALISLEKVLNDRFDSALKRIYIDNVEVKDTKHYYDYGSGRPKYFYDPGVGPPLYFYDPSIFNFNGVDFIVYLPSEIRPGNPESERELIIKIKSDLDYYKVSGVKYDILWLN